MPLTLPRKTIAEKILSAKSGSDARAGDVVVCTLDHLMATDGSMPMTIDYFERMGGSEIANPERIVVALDHYSPRRTVRRRRFMTRSGPFPNRVTLPSITSAMA